MVIEYEIATEVLGKTAQLQGLVYLLDGPKEEYLSGIAKATDLSHSKVKRVVEPLLKEEIILEKRSENRFECFKSILIQKLLRKPVIISRQFFQNNSNFQLCFKYPYSDLFMF